jgi:hypothetical protein
MISGTTQRFRIALLWLAAPALCWGLGLAHGLPSAEAVSSASADAQRYISLAARTQTRLKRAEPQVGRAQTRLFNDERSCVLNYVGQSTRRDQVVAAVMYVSQEVATRPWIGPALVRFSRGLVRVDSKDRVLAGGAAAWSERARILYRWRAPWHSVCGVLRQWAKQHYAQRAAPVAMPSFDRGQLRLARVEAAIARTVRRLRRLRIPAEDAQRFRIFPPPTLLSPAALPLTPMLLPLPAPSTQVRSDQVTVSYR